MCSLWETVICVFVSPSIKQRLRLPGVGIYHSQLHFCILTGQKSLNHKPQPAGTRLVPFRKQAGTKESK